MAEEILPHIFKLDIPLPKNPLKSLNSYVIKGKDRNLIIDTGMNRKECIKAMEDGIEDLELDLEVTDFFITHMHADHSGLVARLGTPTSKLYCSQEDAITINAGDGFWEAVRVFTQTGGFPREEFSAAVKNHPGYKFRALGEIPFSIVKDKDVLQVGDYLLTCVKTPGHTRGHMCLYEAKKRLLFAGDHLLRDITPNISLLSYKVNPLADYLKSLDKVNGYDIELVLPGHRKLFSDYRQRIDELKMHHQSRAEEVLRILAEEGPQNAYRVASSMTWDIDCPTFEEFPIPQKWFATGEALAHLKYLEEKNLIEKKEAGGTYIFSALARPPLVCV